MPVRYVRTDTNNEKCLEGSGRKRIKEMDNEDKMCIYVDAYPRHLPNFN